MKLFSVNCPNCGSPIDIDPDKIARFCGMCGSKVMLDAEAIQRLLIEKEKTKQEYIRATETSKQTEIKGRNLTTVFVFIIGGIVAGGVVIAIIIEKLAAIF